MLGVKKLRKHILMGIANTCIEVAAKRLQVLLGVGQGALIAHLCTRPLLVEAALRARALTSAQVKMTRTAWSRLVACFSMSPLITTGTSDASLLKEAVPECFGEQPCGLLVIVATQSHNRKCRAWFVNAVCEAVVPTQEVVHLEGGIEKFAPETKRLLAIRPPFRG